MGESVLCLTFRLFARLGETAAKFSQQTLLTGSGNSWSQALFALRPSYMETGA
jgi:hypothetical protein